MLCGLGRGRRSDFHFQRSRRGLGYRFPGTSSNRAHRPGMPGLNGLEVLDRIVKLDSAIDVILMTAHFTTESAVEASEGGGRLFAEAGFARNSKGAYFEAGRRRASPASGRPGRPDLATAQLEGMIGRSAAFCEMSSRIRRIAPHYKTVRITGETGTGKDLAARALHNLSPIQRTGVLWC